MIKDKLILIAKKQKTWVEVVITFGCTKETAEDLVQEMYIKIQKLLEKGVTNDIMYYDEINYYYIFKTLKSLFIDFKRKGKNIEKFSLDEPLNESINNYYKYNVCDIINYDEEYKKIKSSLSRMYWYDRKVYEIIEEGETLAELSRQSKIQYYSLYNTYNKVKKKLKKLL